jgi:hypothetical protein
MSVAEVLKTFRELYVFEKSLKRPELAPRTDSENGKSEEDKGGSKVVERTHTWFFDTCHNTF